MFCNSRYLRIELRLATSETAASLTFGRTWNVGATENRALIDRVRTGYSTVELYSLLWFWLPVPPAFAFAWSFDF